MFCFTSHFFLELIDESTVVIITHALHQKSRDEALDHVLQVADQQRVTALACDKTKLALISDIAEAFRVGVIDYDPQRAFSKWTSWWRIRQHTRQKTEKIR